MTVHRSYIKQETWKYSQKKFHRHRGDLALDAAHLNRGSTRCGLQIDQACWSSRVRHNPRRVDPQFRRPAASLSVRRPIDNDTVLPGRDTTIEATGLPTLSVQF